MIYPILALLLVFIGLFTVLVLKDINLLVFIVIGEISLLISQISRK